MVELQERRIRVAVHATGRLMREALCVALTSRPQVDVAGATGSIATLWSLCERCRPDVVLVDGDGLGQRAVESLASLIDTLSGGQVVVVHTGMSSPRYDLAGGGAVKLLPAAAGLDGILDAVCRAFTAGPADRPTASGPAARLRTAAGSRRSAVSTRRAARVARRDATGTRLASANAREAAAQARQAAGGTPLTPHELTIISLLGAGHCVPQVAALLQMGQRTVENHKRHIYEKLGVGNQSHAIARAIALGLLDLHGRAGDAPGANHRAAETGRSTLVLIRGRPGTCRDQVMRAVIEIGQPCVNILVSEPMTEHHAVRWHRGPLVLLLVDPDRDDWVLSTSLGAPTIVLLSEPPDQATTVDAFLRGARGIICVGTGCRDELAAALPMVASGHGVFSAACVGDLATWVSARVAANVDRGVPELTERESDILSSIACGHTIRQTARVLGIAAKTVENTQARLFRKLGAKNRSESLTIAYGLGLVKPLRGRDGPAKAPSRPAGARRSSGQPQTIG